MTQPYTTIGGNGGLKPRPWNIAIDDCSNGKGEYVPSATNIWRTVRKRMSIMWFLRKTGARMISLICGLFIRTAIAKSTAAVHLLKYVDCLSRVRGDRAPWYALINCQQSWPEVRGNVSEVNNLPEFERRKGQEHVAKAGNNRKRVCYGPATPE